MASAPPPSPGWDPYIVSWARRQKYPPGQKNLPPYPVEQQCPYPVEQQCPYPVEQQCSYPVEQQCPYPVEQQCPYPVEQQCPYPVEQYPSRQQSSSTRQQFSSAHDAGYGPQLMPMPPADFTPYQPQLMPMPTLPADFQPSDVELKGDVIMMPAPDLSSFMDKTVQAMFIRKVYILLSLQLLFSCIVIALFMFEENIMMFVRHRFYLYYVSWLIFFGVFIVLSCFENLRRQYPVNIIFLLILTLSMSCILGTFSSIHYNLVPLIAVGICAYACLGVFFFSFHSKFDFTAWDGLLFIILWELILDVIIAFFTDIGIMITLYAGIVALLFTLYVAYSTHTLIEGKTHKISPKEHIFGTLQIYLSITVIFVFLLYLLWIFAKKIVTQRIS